jgi:hypothetical protein
LLIHPLIRVLFRRTDRLFEDRRDSTATPSPEGAHETAFGAAVGALAPWRPESAVSGEHCGAATFPLLPCGWPGVLDHDVLAGREGRWAQGEGRSFVAAMSVDGASITDWDRMQLWAFRAFTGLCVLGLVGTLAVWLPLAVNERRAYETAVACAEGQASDDCLRSEEATVVREDYEQKKTRDYYWIFALPDGTERRVDLQNGPVDDRIEPGATVTVTHWRGEIRSVASGGVTESTNESPGGSRAPFFATAVVLPFTLAFAWCAIWLSRQLKRGRRVPKAEVFPAANACFLAILPFMAGMALVGVADDALDGLMRSLSVTLGTVVLATPLIWWNCRNFVARRG